MAWFIGYAQYVIGDMEGDDPNAERVPNEAIVAAVEELNDAAEAGAVSFEEADGEVTAHAENPAVAARGGF